MNASLHRSVRIVAIACACAAGMLGATSEAHAADPVAPVGGAQAASADQLFEQGVAARKEGKLAEAEELFLRAWAQKKTWDIAANLGMVELKQGKFAEGAGHVAYAIANLPPVEGDATRESLKKAFDAARPEIGEVKLSCEVEGATVRADGKLVGTTPLGASFFVSPGSVTIEVTKDGYEPASKTMEIKKGGTEEVKLTPAARSAPERSKVPAYVIGGMGLAAAIVGGVMLGVGRAERADADASMPRDANHQPLCVRSAGLGPELRPECPGLRSKVAEAQLLSNVGLPILIAGGVTIAGGALYLLWPTPKGEPAKASGRVVPVVSTAGAGLVWTGTF